MSNKVYSDPQYSTYQDYCLGVQNHNQAAAILALWRPFVKVKVAAVCVDVKVAGTSGAGFNIYRNNTSIGQIITTNSAAGFRGTFVPSGTNASYDTTDTLEVRNVLSDATAQAVVHVVYQDAY